MRKTIKQRLIEKLHAEYGIVIDPSKMYSLRQNGRGSKVMSWYAFGGKINYGSYETMSDCLKYPTRLVNTGLFEVVVELDPEGWLEFF